MDSDPPIFALKTPSYDLKASVTYDPDPTKAMICIYDPTRDAYISMSKVVFDMMVDAITNQF